MDEEEVPPRCDYCGRDMRKTGLGDMFYWGCFHHEYPEDKELE